MVPAGRGGTQWGWGRDSLQWCGPWEVTNKPYLCKQPLKAWVDGTVGKMLAVQEWILEFRSQYLLKSHVNAKQAWWLTYSLITKETDMGFMGQASQLNQLNQQALGSKDSASVCKVNRKGDTWCQPLFFAQSTHMCVYTVMCASVYIYKSAPHAHICKKILVSHKKTWE